ncbi:MAG: hypothetical protein IJD58_12715 [Lachnospiraceae bacterium]|nr:hypothetical protein [Lachnospiraceae bacterium]
MKAIIVNCFDTFDNRVKLVREVLKEKKYDISVVTSDFMHIKKEYISNYNEGYEYIHVKRYKRNLSYARINSHYLFAKTVYKKIEEDKPDLIYCILPANSLAKYVSKYKRNNANVKLYFDINDMWPESLPIPVIKNYFPFTIWRNLRNKNLVYADKIITECDLFKNKIKDVVKRNDITTIYMPAMGKEQVSCKRRILSFDRLRLCYLGSINNIIDIDGIVNFIKSVNKQVDLEIIGDGCNVQMLIDATQEVGAHVLYHGLVYEEGKKKEIMSKCHFGLNFMKNSVCVGLTMKSVEYFRFGLPIINNIQGDTWDLIKKEKIGINYDGNIIENLFKDYEIMLNNTAYVFKKYFSKEIIKNKLKDVIM